MEMRPYLFICLFGGLSLLLGASFIFGIQALPTGYDSSCRSVCGLGLIFSLFFGPQIGAYVVGAIWSAIAICLFAFAYRTRR